MKITPLLAVGAVVLAPSTFAQIQQKGSAYLMRYAYSPGKVYSIAVDMTNKVEGLGVDPMTGKTSDKPFVETTSTPTKLKVVSVKSDVATLAVSVSFKLRGGKTQNSSQQVQVDRRGQVVGGKAGQQGLDSVGMFRFPEKAIPIGGTWTAKGSAAGGGQMAMTVDSTYKLVGIKSVNGKQVAVVSAKGVLSGMMKGTVDSTYNLSVSDGFLISATVLVKGSMANPQSNKTVNLTVNATMKRM